MKTGFMQSLPKKILWISGNEGWAYDNHFKRVKAHSDLEHIVVSKHNMKKDEVKEVIEKINPDLIVSGSLKAREFVKDSQIFIFILDGNRQIAGWLR